MLGQSEYENGNKSAEIPFGFYGLAKTHKRGGFVALNHRRFLPSR
jgi:hypothetical protein